MTRTEILDGLRRSRRWTSASSRRHQRAQRLSRAHAAGLRVLLVRSTITARARVLRCRAWCMGGLRYLENGEFTLVKESLVERDGCQERAAPRWRLCDDGFPSSTFSPACQWHRSLSRFERRPSARGHCDQGRTVDLRPADAQAALMPRHRSRPSVRRCEMAALNPRYAVPPPITMPG